ncbi:hypothetical protein BC829DRAFT_382812 [Chytridium lagenaria]|nr:hypothetical protein BC829DRAFT_382812 [Chytridium lagenaria]
MSAVNGTIKAELQEQQPTAIEHPQLSEFNYTSNVSIAQRLQRAPLSSAYKVKQNQTGNVQQEPFPQKPILQPQLQKHIYVTDVRHQQLQYGVVPATSTNIGDKGKTGIIISIVIVIIIGISGTLCCTLSSTTKAHPNPTALPRPHHPSTLTTAASSPLQKLHPRTCTNDLTRFPSVRLWRHPKHADKQCISYSFSNDAVNGYRIAYPYSCSDWWSFWEDGWIRSDDQGCLTAPNLTYEPCDPSNANQQWRID